MSEDPESRSERPDGYAEQPDRKRSASSHRLIGVLVWALIVACLAASLVWVPGWVSGRRVARERAAARRAQARAWRAQARAAAQWGQERELAVRLQLAVAQFRLVDSRLTASLSYEAYLKELGDLKGAFDTFARLPEATRHPAYMHLKSALDRYTQARTDWARKIRAVGERSFDLVSRLDKRMQEAWATARAEVSEAADACRSDVE